MGSGYESPEQEWHDFLAGTHPHFQRRSPLRLIPSSPRCRLCSAPFGSPGHLLLGRYGFTPWEKNPNLCKRCFRGFETTAKACPRGASGDGDIRGAEVEISMLFADVRGSSRLALEMPVWEFTRLMNRFYETSSEVLFGGDAIVEKFVGDEVVGLFIPFMTGPGHARRAVETAERLLRATGHGSEDGPWVPLGAGVHSGRVFVGIVGTGGSAEFTMLGDAANVAAHVASRAAVGECLVTDEAAAAAELDLSELERRRVPLKGREADVVVVTLRSPSM